MCCCSVSPRAPPALRPCGRTSTTPCRARWCPSSTCLRFSPAGASTPLSCLHERQFHLRFLTIPLRSQSYSSPAPATGDVQNVFGAHKHVRIFSLIYQDYAMSRQVPSFPSLHWRRKGVQLWVLIGIIAWCRIVKAVDEALHLSKPLETPITEVGAVIVHFLFALVARLAEAVYEAQRWVQSRCGRRTAWQRCISWRGSCTTSALPASFASLAATCE
jgi:hypothetical protein